MKKLALLLILTIAVSCFTGCTELTETSNFTTTENAMITTASTTNLATTETTVITTNKTTIATTVAKTTSVAVTTTKKSTVKVTTTTSKKETPVMNQGEMVWIPASGTKYHSHSGCSNMKNPTQVSLSDAKQNGYTACKKCY